MSTPTIVHVNLSTGSYPIFCGCGLLSDNTDNTDNANTENIAEQFVGLAGGAAVAVSDIAVWPLYGESVQALFAKYGCDLGEPILLPLGESQKTWETAGHIVGELAARGLRRDGTVVAVGGGVIGDVAGFAAAVYMRGVQVLQIPTTLLAQVDAAIGGKTGVNLQQGKNLAGAFHQPRAVFCDVRTLSSLPMREYRAGLAEVVKYALLGDADFFDWLVHHASDLLARDDDVVLSAVTRSAQHKAAIVTADPLETEGKRVLLNLGHTFAHALEAAAGYGVWLHGEAVAVGLVAAAQLSHTQNNLPIEDVERIKKLLETLQLPICFPMDVTTDDMCERMLLDKKHTAAQTRFVLLDKIGAARQLPIDVQSARAVMDTLR